MYSFLRFEIILLMSALGSELGRWHFVFTIGANCSISRSFMDTLLQLWGVNFVQLYVVLWTICFVAMTNC